MQLAVEWFTVPEGDAGIAATLARMRVLAIDATRDPAVVQLARQVVANVDGHDRWATTETLFEWFTERYVYTLDPTDYELVVAPRVMLDLAARTGTIQGDCDDASTLLAALLESVGVATRFRVVGRERQSDADAGYIHVLVEANTGGDVWLPLDVTLNGARAGDRPPAMASEAVYDSTGFHAEEPMISRMGGVGQFDFEMPGLDALDFGGSSLGDFEPGSFDLGVDSVIASPDVSLGSQYSGMPVTQQIPSAGVSGTTDWSKILADVTGGVIKVGSAALPLLERYGALTPVAGSVPLQYPGETSQQYAARVAAGGFQSTLANTPTTTWLLLGGGALLLVFLMRGRGRR